jgi:hypothetical protein
MIKILNKIIRMGCPFEHEQLGGRREEISPFQVSTFGI